MEKLNRNDFLKVHAKEISDLVELIPLYKTEGYNRLQIWKEFRSSGIRGDILIEAFRRTGLL